MYEKSDEILHVELSQTIALEYAPDKFPSLLIQSENNSRIPNIFPSTFHHEDTSCCLATTVTTTVASANIQNTFFFLIYIAERPLPVGIFPEHCSNPLLFHKMADLNLLSMQIACLPL